jgi:hypothetical protein
VPRIWHAVGGGWARRYGGSVRRSGFVLEDDEEEHSEDKQNEREGTSPHQSRRLRRIVSFVSTDTAEMVPKPPLAEVGSGCGRCQTHG